MMPSEPDVSSRQNEAVPVASADESLVMALNVNVPPVAAGAAVADSGQVARRVLPAKASLTEVGGVPS